MGRYRCDNTNSSGARCILAQSHNGRVRCKFKSEESEPERVCDKAKPLQRMNKTEARYAAILEARRLAGEIVSYEYEALTFRLADRVRYTPDFTVIRHDGTVEFHEVKGPHIWEDARIKLRVAAARFPSFKFDLAQFNAGAWTISEIAA